MAKRTVLLYNSDGFDLVDVITFEKARKMIHREIADIMEGEFRIIDDRIMVVSLQKIILNEYRSYTPPPIGPFTYVPRRLILLRDRNTCGYCLEFGDTIDHIFPACRGGANTWENLITACRACNGFKADRTPSEAGMRLRLPAYTPNSTTELIADRTLMT